MSHNSLPHHFLFFFFNDTATTEIYTLSLHDALPISTAGMRPSASGKVKIAGNKDGTITAFAIDCHGTPRSEEHTSELQSQSNLVCRLLLEKKKNKTTFHARSVSAQALHIFTRFPQLA